MSMNYCLMQCTGLLATETHHYTHHTVHAHSRMLIQKRIAKLREHCTATYPHPSAWLCATDIAASEFEFDRRDKVSKTELQSMMLAEMAHFRPGYGVAGGRPQSARLAAHARVAASGYAFGGGGAGKATAASFAHATPVSPGHSYAAAAKMATAATAPAPAVAAFGKSLPPPAAAASAGAGGGGGGSFGVAAEKAGGRPLAQGGAQASIRPVSGQFPPNAATTNAAVSRPGGYTGSSELHASAAPYAPLQPPTLPPAHTSSGGVGGSLAPTSAGPQAAPVDPSTALLTALLGEMRALRSEILTTVDRKLSELSGTIGTRVEEQVNHALAPTISRLDRLEATIGAAARSSR